MLFQHLLFGLALNWHHELVKDDILQSLVCTSETCMFSTQGVLKLSCKSQILRGCRGTLIHQGLSLQVMHILFKSADASAQGLNKGNLIGSVGCGSSLCSSIQIRILLLEVTDLRLQALVSSEEAFLAHLLTGGLSSGLELFLLVG